MTTLIDVYEQVKENTHNIEVIISKLREKRIIEGAEDKKVDKVR